MDSLFILMQNIDFWKPELLSKLLDKKIFIVGMYRHISGVGVMLYIVIVIDKVTWQSGGYSPSSKFL